MRARLTLRLALLFGCVVLAAACTSPIGVRFTDASTVHQKLVQSALSGDRASSFSRAVLLRSGLGEAFEDEPELTLERMRLDIYWADAPARLFALAELSFLHAKRTGSRSYYRAAAVYAYAFLFPDSPTAASWNGFDPRIRIAANLYNRGITRGFGRSRTDRVDLRDHDYRLPFGRIEVDIDERDLFLGDYELHDFQAVADLSVHGLRNRYRFPGIGAPLAAGVRLARGVTPASTPIPAHVRLPVTAVLLIEQPRAGIENGRVKSRLELFAADADDAVEINGSSVPLEFETTAALASTLTLSRFWESETARFFGDLGIRPPDQFGKGLFMLHPYQKGRIPIVLVHGTASSPGRWAELVNEVLGVSIFREHYQIWFFTYDTGQPVSYSAGLLRDALATAVREFDREGTDETLRQMVVMGHSQGGLLTKLTSVSSGDRFWTHDVPFEFLDLDPAHAKVLRNSFFFEPLPFVKRLVFVATPHRGSYLTLWTLTQYLAELVTLPVQIVDAMADAIARNPALGHASFDKIPTALDDMRPSNPFLVTLESLPIDPGVKAHSIIAVRGDGPAEEGSDGVVEYRSAHLEGVESELVLRSGHSMQSHPGTILEIGRILIEHLLELGLVTNPEAAPVRDALEGGAAEAKDPGSVSGAL